jgi:asparagine synthase (glutamine-hydrolysing)
MGNFLVVAPAEHSLAEAERLFRSGLDFARDVKGQRPGRTVETGWAFAAAFPRRNGSGGAMATDPETGSWLLTCGTWFHADGAGPGDEGRLLRRYLEVGPVRLARELEGFFVVVVGDGRTRETVVLTDVVGSCHAFAREWGNAAALSGSSLLLAGLDGSTPDPVACREFLATGIIYEDRTVHREVRKLGPAGVFRLANDARQGTQRYWRISDLEPESLDGQEAVRALGESIGAAARRVAKAFANPVCDLTGGYDSRVLVALFRTAGVRFSTTVTGPEGSPDVVVSRGLAKLAGLAHLHVPPVGRMTFDRLKDAFTLTDGEYDLVEYARILDVHQQLAGQFDVSLNGSFGEVARGYWWEVLSGRPGARGPLDAGKVARLRYAVGPYDPALFAPGDRLDLVAHFAGVIGRTNEGLTGLPETVQMDHAYLMMRMQRWQGRIGSSTNQLWPCLPPLLFRSVLEVMLRAKARLRRRSLLARRLLAEFQPEMAAYPLEHGHPALPLTWKTAHRFWPLVPHYGRKVVRKLLARVGGGGARPAAAVASWRQQLWGEEEVRDLLHAPTMRLAAVADPAGLADFLRRSREPGFRYDGQWARALSLEYTLRVLEGWRARQRGLQPQLIREG